MSLNGTTDNYLAMLDYLLVNNIEIDMRRRIRLTEGDLRRMIKESVKSLIQNSLYRRGSLTEGRGDTDIIRDYKRIMPFAVDEIFSGNVGKSPVDLIDGYVITRISPESTGRWSVYDNVARKPTTSVVG